MNYLKLPFVLIVLIVAVFTVKALYVTPIAFQARQPEDNSNFPIASIEEAKSSDTKENPKRKIKGKRYDNWNIVNKTAEQGGIEIVSEIEYPALPVVDSDAIVIGEIVKAQAHLSNDLGGIYSEFTTRVNQVLKQDSHTTIVLDSSISVERPGGRVLFPSGKIAKYHLRGQGMPRQGRVYLLFLKRIEDDYKLITGYELRSGKVSPIDGAISSVGDKKWPSDLYIGADQSQLLADLQKEINNPSQKVVVY